MLTADDADRLADGFALGAARRLEGPVARGVIGQIWRLETDAGSWAVKEWFDEPDRAELEQGAAFQDAAAVAGVPSPRTRPSRNGAFLDDGTGTLVRVQEWVDLRAPDPMLDPQAVGRLVATLHGVPFDGRQPVDPWYVEPIGVDRWEALVTALGVAGAPFAGRLAALLEELAALDALVVAPCHLRTCHRDLWADNLRATSSGELCVIDWEDCGLADPSMELAVVLWEFGRTSAERARSLYVAYLDAGGPGRIDGTGAFSMAIAQLGHIGARACVDWLRPNATDDERAFAAAWFAEFADEPLTRSTIAMLLGAVAG